MKRCWRIRKIREILIDYGGPLLVISFPAGQLFAKPQAKPQAKSQNSSSRSGVFDLERLPIGKNVTFPRPATTIVPALARVQFTGTDMPQSLSLKAVGAQGGNLGGGSLRISIYDQNAERVIHTEIQGDTVYLYHLRDLRPILVLTEGGDHRLKLQVESNKPLDIGR